MSWLDWGFDKLTSSLNNIKNKKRNNTNYRHKKQKVHLTINGKGVVARLLKK